MENERKVEEPFDPERTPAPPQEMDPRAERRRDHRGNDGKQKKQPGTEDPDQEKPKVLGESETEITDETTI